MTAKRPQFRLFDFQVSEHREEIYDKYGNVERSNRTFLVKMFGMNTKGKTYCVFAKNFKPFFYVLGKDNWIKGREDVALKMHIIERLKKEKTGLQDDICSCTLVSKKKLYGLSLIHI